MPIPNDKICTLIDDQRFVALCDMLRNKADKINGLDCTSMEQLAEERGIKKGIEASVQFLTILRSKGKGNGATI